jgi:hypothetical protein
MTPRQEKLTAKLNRLERKLANTNDWFDIQELERDIRVTKRELETANKTAARQAAREAKRAEEAARFEALPESLKKFFRECEENEYQEELKKNREYYGDTDYLREISRRHAKATVEELASRFTSKLEQRIGKIVDADCLTIDSATGEINGWVKGEKDTVFIETILAGGYNIQRLHNRTIFHK